MFGTKKVLLLNLIKMSKYAQKKSSLKRKLRVIFCLTLQYLFICFVFKFILKEFKKKTTTEKENICPFPQAEENFSNNWRINTFFFSHSITNLFMERILVLNFCHPSSYLDSQMNKKLHKHTQWELSRNSHYCFYKYNIIHK